MPPPIFLGTLAGAGIGTIYGWLKTRSMSHTISELQTNLQAAPNTHAQDEIAYDLVQARLIRISRISVCALIFAAVVTLLVVVVHSGLFG